MELEQRRAATQATLDEWRGKAFDWNSCVEATCVHMLDAHLRNMGHEPPTIPKFSTATGALKALRSAGWDNLESMLDDLLDRLPSVSFMQLGDVVLAEGEGPFDAIFICAGPMKVFGWHETRDDLVIVDVNLDQLKGAWRTHHG